MKLYEIENWRQKKMRQKDWRPGVYLFFATTGVGIVDPNPEMWVITDPIEIFLMYCYDGNWEVYEDEEKKEYLYDYWLKISKHFEPRRIKSSLNWIDLMESKNSDIIHQATFEYVPGEDDWKLIWAAPNFPVFGGE